MIFNAACVFIQQFLFAAPFFFFSRKSPTCAAVVASTTRGTAESHREEKQKGEMRGGQLMMTSLPSDVPWTSGFNIQPVVPVFMIREASKPDLVVRNAEEIIDAAACESLWTSSKTLMQIDNVASLSLSLPPKYKEGTCKPREPNVCEV